MSFKKTAEKKGRVVLSTGEALVWLAVVLSALAAISLGLLWFTAPAKVAIENRTFHQSQAYTDGMARDLYDLQAQYQSASPAGKDAIRATVRERFAGFNPSSLPPSLQSFLMEMQ
jgi:hypothetical protein